MALISKQKLIWVNLRPAETTLFVKQVTKCRLWTSVCARMRERKRQNGRRVCVCVIVPV